ncbi:hypothetical protein [Bradyrhizobium sp. Rc3b]|uniref:hypothetical protein n=1 Tax=Bradyrhizobium sp. Rc3b TaxID=1855322 RepID=UPI0015A6FEDB|nr:hypothetical protein [Bradyrhizobium sp. Rc3b]
MDDGDLSSLENDAKKSIGRATMSQNLPHRDFTTRDRLPYGFSDYAGRRLDRGEALATGHHLHALLG